LPGGNIRQPKRLARFWCYYHGLKNEIMAQANFAELVNNDTPTVVDFYAEWCGPCKMMKPILEQVKNNVGDKVRIIKIDVDKNQALAEMFKIRGVPTLALFKKGELKWIQPGVVQAHQLESIIEQYSSDKNAVNY
jgi:thioredoxin 1